MHSEAISIRSTCKVLLFAWFLLAASAETIAGTVVCTNCPPPNSAPCEGPNCSFANANEFALNGVLLLIRDPSVMKLISSEANRKSKVGNFPGPKDTWWRRNLTVIEVKESVEFGPTRLIQKRPGIIAEHPVFTFNCGNNKRIMKRTLNERTLDQITRELEKTLEEEKTMDTTVDVKVQFGKYGSAGVNQKISSRVKTFQRDFLRTHKEIERTKFQSDDIELPAHSVLDETVVTSMVHDLHGVEGIVTVDATLVAPGRRNVSIGRWSHFETDTTKRQVPVKVTFAADVPRTEFRLNVREFANERECLDAMTRQPEPEMD